MSDLDLMQLSGFDFSRHGDSETDQVNDSDFSTDSPMIVPSIKPRKKLQGKPVIVVIDDDYSTLDLMKIYLQRDYEYAGFDSARDAIFYLNNNVPALIFLDSYINRIGIKRVIEIIRSYKELKDVPIVILTEPDEKGAVLSKGYEGISGIITRPVARGELQKILDEILVN